MQKCYIQHTEWHSVTIYMSYSKTHVFKDDKVHRDFKTTYIVMMMTPSHWWQVFQHVRHTKHYSKDFTRMNLSSTKQHVRERSHPPYWGEKSFTLRNSSDQTVKKRGNSTWAQVVGRDNWTLRINQLTSREGKCIHREFPENTWIKFKEAEIQQNSINGHNTRSHPLPSQPTQCQ